ncbi:hypothetical protein D3C80_1882550 [compost metagenome]
MGEDSWADIIAAIKPLRAPRTTCNQLSTFRNPAFNKRLNPLILLTIDYWPLF